MKIVTVRELLAALPDAHIYGGGAGMDKPIHTVSFIDSPSSVDWLKGGELILTTAFLYSENGEMQVKFIQKLIEMGVTALGIKIGRYVEEVSSTVIEIADENKFPIFGISFDTVWSEIFSVFYSLSSNKKKDRSILSTEMIVFDKLFRSSTWDSEAIRSHFIKCIEVPAVIVDDDYNIIGGNSGSSDAELNVYCGRRRKYHTGNDFPKLFMAHTKNAKKIFDTALYYNERLILCTDNGEVVWENELAWVTMLYESIRNKNKFMQDVASIWKNFLHECIIEGREENLKDYARVLSINENKIGVILIFSGEEALTACNEFKRMQRSLICSKEVLIYNAETNGRIIVFYQTQEKMEYYLFLDHLRKELGKVADLFTNVHIWAGQPVERLNHLKDSYSYACRTGEWGGLLLPKENLLFFRDIELLERLHSMNHDYSEITYLEQQITSFDACRTLEIYLESGNIKRAAECAFINDNTMRYRIQKLEQCLNLNLNKPMNRLNLLIKIKLWRIAGQKDGSYTVST